MQQFLQLSTTEEEMFGEIFSVLSKYKTKTREFGLQLVHSHFPICENEILYETHDKKRRVLNIVPRSRKQFKKLPKATAWNFRDGKIEISMFCCDGGGEGPPIGPVKRLLKK